MRILIMPEVTPDIVLLGAEWQPRALIRAQLIEEGFDVVAVDTWPAARRHLRVGSKPRLAIGDLQGLPNPKDVLHALRVLMTPNRVLVLTAIGSVPVMEIEPFGFRMLCRPLVIGTIVEAVRGMIRSADASPAWTDTRRGRSGDDDSCRQVADWQPNAGERRISLIETILGDLREPHSARPTVLHGRR